VRANLVQPDTGKRSSAVVAFTVLADGQIRQESLKVIASSGQSKLDQTAVKTVRTSVPFEPPPKEITVALTVDFGPKH
jgi:periplasmic protein TonB